MPNLESRCPVTWLSALNVGEPRDLDGEIFCALLSFLSAYLVAFWLCDSVIFGDQHCPCPLPLHLPLAPCPLRGTVLTDFKEE